MNAVVAGLAGLLFGAGLVISGMTDANKVIAFLDVGGDWDPSLALVMGGAVAVHWVLYRLILRRPSPLWAEAFRIPSRSEIDGRLILGAALFGVGWGMGGFCPGPGLVASTGLGAEALVFTATMLVGMLGFHQWSRRAATAEGRAASGAATEPAGSGGPG